MYVIEHSPCTVILPPFCLLLITSFPMIFPPCILYLSMQGAYTLCKGNMGQHNFSVRVGKFDLVLPSPQLKISEGFTIVSACVLYVLCSISSSNVVVSQSEELIRIRIELTLVHHHTTACTSFHCMGVCHIIFFTHHLSSLSVEYNSMYGIRISLVLHHSFVCFRSFIVCNNKNNKTESTAMTIEQLFRLHYF